MSVETSLKRKQDHIDLCHEADVGLPGDRGLFDDVRLIHQALPELALTELDLSTTFLDHQLALPMMVTGMTGGPKRAGDINQALAAICEKNGLAFGLGSQRITTNAPSTMSTFNVRSVAPNVCLLGNIGVNQARDLGPATVRQIFEATEADYMAVHLNPAMELTQPGADADSDFSSGLETIARLVDTLDGRVIVKECGCGLSPSLVGKLQKIGVRAVDVSGVGGTSWVRLEAMRAEGAQAEIGFDFDDWGIPTAASTWAAAQVNEITVIASGGVYSGRVAARALALGADVVGFARPLLQAFLNEGSEGAQALIDLMARGIRTSMALTGTRTPSKLRENAIWVGPRLNSWMDCLRREKETND